MREAVLLIVKDKGNLVDMDMPAIQARAYFLSRRIQHDYGFYFNYYSVWSDKVYETVMSLYQEGLIRHRLSTMVKSCYEITPAGEKALEASDERRIMLLEANLSKIVNNEIFHNRNHLQMALVMDQVMQRVGGKKDKVRILNNLRILGWYPTLSAFSFTHGCISKIGMTYKKEVIIDRRRQDSERDS